VQPNEKNFNFTELLYVIQEMLEDEGKKYLQAEGYKRAERYRIFKRFTQHLIYRNLANYDSMVLITSEKGCITGDALLEMPRDLTKYPKGIPLKELVNKGPQWIYSFNKKSKKIEVKQCDRVEFVKEVDVYEVELTNGQKIQATEDHPFLLTNGDYKQLKELVWCAKIKKNGKLEHNRFMKDSVLTYTDRLRIIFRPDAPAGDNFIKYNYSNINWKEGDTAYKHSIMEHKLIAEAIFGHITNKVIHHKDNNHYNNNPNNIKVLENQKEHFLEHNMGKYAFKKNNTLTQLKCGIKFKKGLPKIKSGSEEFCKMMSNKRIAYFNNPLNSEKIKIFSEKRKIINPIRSKCQTGGIIKSITYIGKKAVYDVINVQDNHNFIVNGFVVSNSGKSSAAIMMARQWCKELGIKFNPKRHIAYNNADVMNKIDALNIFEPIICDEAVRFACITGDTLIKTPKGEIAIKNIVNKKNFKVISYNEKTKKYEIQIAEKCVKVKNNVVFLLETEDGKKIKATKEHKFLTTKGWKMLGELKEGDELIDL
jgi:hypothetical protein